MTTVSVAGHIFSPLIPQPEKIRRRECAARDKLRRVLGIFDTFVSNHLRFIKKMNEADNAELFQTISVLRNEHYISLFCKFSSTDRRPFTIYLPLHDNLVTSANDR